MHRIRHSILFRTAVLLLALPAFLTGCGNSEAPGANNGAGAQQQADRAPTNGTSAASWDKIKFKADGGETAFSLKRADDGAKLVDGSEAELARYSLKENKLKIKAPDDSVTGYVIALDGYLKIENGDQTVELFKLQRQDDGDWKLERGDGTFLSRVKKRDYGFEIENEADESLGKIKLKDGKTSIRDAGDKTLLYTKDPVATMAVACLALDEIESQELRAGLMAMMILNEK